MRTLSLLVLLILSHLSHAQQTQLKAVIIANDLPAGQGKAVIYAQSDSSMIKGDYLDSNLLELNFDRKNQTSFFLKIIAPGFSDTTINFEATDSLVDLGTITLDNNMELDAVKVSYVKPMFERTMDGIKVNVDGTQLGQLNTLFDVLKASPRLTSPDEESIEIIGRGSPLILIDRQAIITNDELKAIPASQVDRIEINTNPSSKYKAQGSGNGVIEVFTKNFSLEGYSANIRASGGLSTQKKPGVNLNGGFSYKKKKFTMNTYLGGNYNSSNSYGSNSGATTDTSARSMESSYHSDNYNFWQYYNVKSAYKFNDKQQLSMGVNGYGSIGGYKNVSETDYYVHDALQTSKDKDSDGKYIWQNNSAFLNYTQETDTFNSVLEINLNYTNKISEDNGTYLSSFVDNSTSLSSRYDIRTQTHDRPNIGEFRINYEHHFDSTNWELSVGSAYSLLINGKRFDRDIYQNNEWQRDPVFSNSYDYQEHIGAVFAEVSNKWDKIGFRIGVRGEYTRLDGYSHSLNKQFMDSSYILPFPTASLMFTPNDSLAFTLFYKSGIDRPQFSNYDPFIIIEDSLNIQYGNPFLRPAIEHSFGLETDILDAINFTVTYEYIRSPQSSISFINDSSFVTAQTPWNADHEENLSFSLSVPIDLKWLQGWNSIWYDYEKYVFTPEFGRGTFYNPTFGIYSYLNFILPKKFNITNNISVNKWGNSQSKNNVNYRWSIRLTKKFLDNDLQFYLEAYNLFPPKYKSESFSGNYVYNSISRYNFTTFSLGLYYKFGRLKAPTNIQDSKSGQSDRI